MIVPQKLERSIEISKFCEKIASLDSEIYCVSIVNKNGRILETRLRDDSPTTNLTQQQFEMLYMQRTLQVTMTREFDEKIGLFDYSITFRNSMLELIFPFDSGIIFVGVNPQVMVQKTVNQISEMVKELERKKLSSHAR